MNKNNYILSKQFKLQILQQSQRLYICGFRLFILVVIKILN